MLKVHHLLKEVIAALMIVVLWCAVSAAGTLPYIFTNNSEFSDDQVYVAIVGITDGHVWVDAKTGEVNPMSASDNTVEGPVIDGNLGPGENGLYADCFTPLSEIPDKTVQIPQIAGCRIMMSFGSQLYLYFFGYSGSPSGYAAPNLANSTDPNQGIKFEMIELTYNDNGLWCNTTRVDSYQYPMGLEVSGVDFYKKVGEINTHEEIISRWQQTAPDEFQGCLDSSQGIIHFPTKTADFQSGGANAEFLQEYIDAVWQKYSSDELAFDSGEAGVWRGSVSNEQFSFTRDSDGATAVISQRPTTIEAMEGSGVLATGSQWDLVVQAQFCAALTRHAIDLNASSGTVQNWGEVSSYYQTWPYNWYAKFWHQSDISYEGLTYAFCYDDVFDQSATIHTSQPESVNITIGGFAGTQDLSDSEDTSEDSSDTSSILIEAEDYALKSGMDVETCEEGGENMGWMDTGTWIVWDAELPSSGDYTVEYRIASLNGGGVIQFEKAGGDPVYGTIDVPATGSWQTWETISHTVALEAGEQQIAIYVPSGGYNLNWIRLTPAN